MGLSVVFLLLYVTASLRSGTTGLQQQVEKERLTQKVEDLQNQLQVYNALKKEYLQQGATEQEEKLYQGLMSRLDLLQEEAKTEKDKLRQQALENEQKEQALNQYQQLVRNMINANMIAKTRIKKRDEVIVEKDVVISENEKQISNLNTNIQQKQNEIAENERQIAMANQELNKRMTQLRNAYKTQKMTKKAFEQQMAQAQAQSQQKVQSLQAANNQFAQQLNQSKAQLGQLSGQLAQTSQALSATSQALSVKEAEARGLAGKLEQTKGEYEGKLNAARGEYQGKLEEAKGQFQAASAAQAKQYGEKISGLSGKLANTEQALQKAIQEANARKEVASEIRRGFAKAGIKAEVDGETGDVMIDFGDHYFDSGRADLKTGMVNVLKKAFPIYAASLMENPKLRDKVENVEIIGFASPTYQGKLVDPNTLDMGDRKAVDFNLDLSYARAKSIFQYLFDSKKMTFNHQRQLLPLVKVSGRSFLAEAKNMRDIASDQNAKGKFCEKYDCKKAQRVIIKFSVKQ